MVTCTVAKRELEGESSWITKGQCDVQLPDCLLLLKSKGFSDNSYQIITIILPELNVSIPQFQGLADI